jgi:hypothetical protein
MWSAATELVASQYALALCDVGWALCYVALRAVVVSRIAASHRLLTAGS